MSSITGTVKQTVVLGSAKYQSPLTIYGTGAIKPVAAGAAGIYVPASVAGGVIINEGLVQAADGRHSAHAGGIGIDLLAAANVTNSGTIAGGDAVFYSHGAKGPNGGLGVSMTAGGYLGNSGLITGGEGGLIGNGLCGDGGAGVLLKGATLNNTGTIHGGAATSVSGRNASAGYGGTGVDLRGGSTATNGGLIMGGAGAYDGGSGGTGVDISHSSLSNTGTIIGGVGGDGYYQNGGAGGVGVYVRNHGHLLAGGLIEGGAGGYGHFYGGPGGTGVVIRDSTVMATGVIEGGRGGSGGEAYAGTGGIGVLIENGGVLTLTGSVVGGLPGAYGYPGDGGVGVMINGGTLIDSGAIAGGTSTYNGTADAVRFTGAGTLTVEAGASFTGNVVGATGAELNLGGAAAGTLTGLGTSIYGFNNVAVAHGSDWTLAGNVSGSETITLGSHSILTAGGALGAAQLTFAGPAELVVTNLPDTTSLLAGFGAGDKIDLAGLTATSLAFNDGTLTLLSSTGTLGTLDFSGSYTQSDFALASDHNGGTLVKYSGDAASSVPLHEPAGAFWQFNFQHTMITT